MTGETVEAGAPPREALAGTPRTEARREARRRLSGHLALAGVLMLAIVLRLWRLRHNGFGQDYYSAGVRSMTESWHNFFFNAFDPTGFVSLDKPPVAFWIQAAAARIFGFGSPAVLVPQALEGAASIAILYHLVRRRFGVPAGLLAALFLALTPLSVAVDRSSNTDSCLLLALLIAAWIVLKAAETGNWLTLFVGMAALGVAFNVKMLAAFVLLPSLAIIYLAGDWAEWRQRLVQLAVGGAVLASVSLSWITAYDLTPPDERPYVGSSTDNSMLELAVGHNGIERFVHRRHRPPAAQRPDAGAAQRSAADTAQPPVAGADPAAIQAARRVAYGRAADHVPAGLLRLADRHLASQTGWLFPLALLGLAAALARTKQGPSRDPRRLSLLLWALWGATCIVVYSAAGGIFHAYYTLPLAAPLAALAGIGIVALWEHFRADGLSSWWLPAGLAATAAWQAYIEYAYLGTGAGDWRRGLYGLLLGGAALGGTGLILARARLRDGTWRAVALGAAACSILALLVTPAAWALSTVIKRGNVGFPAADLLLLAPPAEAPRDGGSNGWALEQRLVAYLQRERRGERYLLATSDARSAAPIIIHTGEPVLAMGGFSGTDPILTPERLAALVAGHEVRFVLLTAPGFGQGERDMLPETPLADWVRDHGRRVDPDLWRPAAAGGDEAATAAGGGLHGVHRRAMLYDLAPRERSGPNAGEHSQ
jgi:4-amino-4-deoxy-L-arabinose transferase-like glycosyltransferase